MANLQWIVTSKLLIVSMSLSVLRLSDREVVLNWNCVFGEGVDQWSVNLGYRSNNAIYCWGGHQFIKVMKNIDIRCQTRVSVFEWGRMLNVLN